MGNTFNQTHSGSGDNIVNVGHRPFRLTDEMLCEVGKILADTLPRNHWIDLKTMVRDQEMGDRLEAYLRMEGWQVKREQLIMLGMSAPLQRPLTVLNRGDHSEMILDSSVTYE